MNTITLGFVTDGHYGAKGPQNRLNYDQLHSNMVTALKQNDVDLVLFGGDNFEGDTGDPKTIAENVVPEYYCKLGSPYWAARGNHDRITDENWRDVFGHDPNYWFEFEQLGVIILNTVDADGNEIDPDRRFLTDAFQQLSHKESVFILSHYWFNSDYDEQMTGPGQTDLRDEQAVELIHQQNNVRAVLHGHNHGENTGTVYWLTKNEREKPYVAGRIFGGHIGAERVAEGYWIIEVTSDDGSLKSIEAIFKRLSDNTVLEHDTLF